MAKKNMLLLPLVAMLLSSCTTLSEIIDSSSHPSSFPSSQSSEEVATSEEIPSSAEELSSEVLSSLSDTSSEDLPDDLTPADLTNFKTTYPSDPLITYTDDDYIVRPFPNGFTYPADARVKPTNAYLEFWHPETELNMRIIATKEVFNLIEQNGYHNPRFADCYFPVTLEIKMNGKRFVYYEVGMRMKGNTSRTEFLDPTTKEFIKSISFKLSFNELWDEAIYDNFNLRKEWTKALNPEWKVRDDRTFMGDTDGKFGMKKVDLKWNKSPDPSLVMQPFVFSLFRRNGLISQNSTLTTLKMNDTRFGIVTVNEPIDKHLLRRYFDKNGAAGQLYKVGWGKPDPNNHGYWVKGSLRYEDLLFGDDGKLIHHAILGEEDKYNYYEPGYDAKEYDATSENPFAKMIDLMKMLQDIEGKSVAEAKLMLEAKIDMNSFLRYAALCYLTGNPDDMRNNGNNYYVFFNPNEGNKAYFIPYDYDWSLNIKWDGVGDMSKVYPFHSKHEGHNRAWQENRLFWATIINKDDYSDYHGYDIKMNNEYRSVYVDFVRTFIADEQYSDTYYNVIYNTYVRTYGAKTISDFDTQDYKVSPFIGTDVMTSFINTIKATAAPYI
ncbi:MAG: CotH protein [Tenericutes bacterium ADurb.Bin087]|nr:MAG: CotH protein [Tenericutes bacterium ADurb.Bin087]